MVCACVRACDSVVMYMCLCVKVAVSGYCYAVAGLLGTVRSNELGLPSAKARSVLALGQELVAIGMGKKEMDKAHTYINGGWALIGSFISLGEK